MVPGPNLCKHRETEGGKNQFESGLVMHELCSVRLTSCPDTVSIQTFANGAAAL